VQIWHYDEGSVRLTGVGHSGPVVAVAYSPDNRSIVSVGEEGAILLWRNTLYVEGSVPAPTPAPAAAPASALIPAAPATPGRASPPGSSTSARGGAASKPKAATPRSVTRR